MSNTLNTSWDIASPAAGAFVSAIPLEMRMLRASVKLRIDYEHLALGASGAGGEHKQGSAKAYYQSTEPTLRPDGVTAFNTSDNGRIWYDTATGLYKVYIHGTGWSSAAAGSVLLTGNQTVAGIKTFTSTPVLPTIGNGLLPVGAMLDFGGAAAPTGYLLCYGQAISRTTYAVLFAIIGTTFGVGNGTTTFNVPDFRGRTGIGKDNMGGSSANVCTDTLADTLGGKDGHQTHTLIDAEMPSHTHTVTAYGTQNSGNASRFYIEEGDTQYSITSSSAGSDDPHNNMQPYIAMNVIIKY